MLLHPLPQTGKTPRLHVMCVQRSHPLSTFFLSSFFLLLHLPSFLPCSLSHDKRKGEGDRSLSQTFSLYLSLSHTHLHTRARTHTHTHTHTHTYKTHFC